MKKLLLLLFLISFTTLAQTFVGKVISIKDGDTVVVIDSLNKSTTLKLANEAKKADFVKMNTDSLIEW